MRHAISLIVGAALAFSSVEPAFADDRKAVTIEVVDADTGKPIPQYRYQYWIETADGKGNIEQRKWQSHDATKGALQLQAPLACEITLGTLATEYEGGFGRTTSHCTSNPTIGNANSL